MPLVVVPTPIGNLEDITLRGLRELQEADLIACEDVRRTLKLLNHYEIKKPLISCHEHNERDRIDLFLSKLLKGDKIVLVSDAGTPGISDPGYPLISAAIEANLEVDILPGANALLPALLFSGLQPSPFAFIGFLKGKRADKILQLKPYQTSPLTLILYVSPHRLSEQLQFILQQLGDRRAALSRELSKVYQQTIRGTLDTIISHILENEVRGEYVLVVEGATPQSDDVADNWTKQTSLLAESGMSDKDVTRTIAEQFGIPKNKIKQFLLKEREEVHDN